MTVAAKIVVLSSVASVLPFLPLKWIIFGAAVYLLGQLPFDHYWDLRVRELYPYRQWKIERLAMRLLHWTRLIPTSRLTSRSNRIPIELWVIILDYAIDAPFCFDTACEPKYFAAFIRAQTSSVKGREYVKSEEDRKKLRAVCKLWSSLLSERTMRWVASKKEWHPSGAGLIRVELPVDGKNHSKAYQDVITHSIVWSTRQFRSLTTLTLQGNSIGALQSLMHACQENQLKQVKAFSLGGGHTTVIPAVCLREMQVSFSRLRCLCLDGEVAYGGIMLPELDILYLDVLLTDPGQWSFPSLRHLAIGDRCFPERPFDLAQMPAITDNLLSLLLLQRGYTMITADDRFWKQLASLQFLGLRLNHLDLVDEPPLSHPLFHLYLTDSTYPRNYPPGAIGRTTVDVRRVATAISRLPSLKFVTLPTVCHEREDRYPAERKVLFGIYRDRGVTWLKQNCTTLQRPAKRTVKWWEDILWHSWTCYCGISIILHLWYSCIMQYTALLAVALAYVVWVFYDMYIA